jgi:outer membrane protein assembly factor BamB
VDDSTPQTWRLYCLDKRDGSTLWERDLHKGVPAIKRHTKGSHANSTPATDGRHVVTFLGSEGLYCHDMEGALLWKKDLGRLDSGFFRVKEAQWGFGSSPIIHEDMVVVQCDVQENSFVAVFKVKDGSEVWRRPRDEVPTWSTPTVAESGDRTMLILNGYKHIGAYDFRSGSEIWRLRGGGDIPTPTPVVGHGLVFITNAHGRMAPIFAIRLTASGDLGSAEGLASGTHVAWWQERGGTYMQTPLLLGEELYFFDGSGRVSCYTATTGESVYRERVGEGTSGFTASPIAIGETIYFASENGEVYVIKAGRKFELIATSEMNEICMATPAASEGTLFVRTTAHVVAIGPSER